LAFGADAVVLLSGSSVVFLRFFFVLSPIVVCGAVESRSLRCFFGLAFWPSCCRKFLFCFLGPLYFFLSPNKIYGKALAIPFKKYIDSMNDKMICTLRFFG
jgi:hypothetical protein